MMVLMMVMMVMVVMMVLVIIATSAYQKLWMGMIFDDRLFDLNLFKNEITCICDTKCSG